MTHTTLTSFMQRELQKQAHPERARAMAAYMKTTMPFHGVPAPMRRDIVMRAIRIYPITSQHEYHATIGVLWRCTYREEKYMALDIARLHASYADVHSMPLFEQMIREGAWWDFVDTIAVHLVGSILAKDSIRMWPMIESWIADDCLWIRRTAIICQNAFKKKTDRTRLFSFCVQRAHEKEFFIRKAIGWALREYSKVEPGAVRALLDEHGTRFSNLSCREALKRIVVRDGKK